jgi:HSP20 family protein
MYNRRAFHKNWNHNNADKYRNCGGHPLKKAWKESFKAALNNPPANVKELDDRYELHLFAPGYEKSDFVIALKDKNLSISVENKKDTEQNWKRQEYTPKGFLRQFALNDKIDKAAILAKYENGVLIISLPKLEGHETSRQEIAIA